MNNLEDELSNVLLKRGTRVLHLYWDSGGPGAGADCEDIYKFQDVYWVRSSSGGFSGPYDSLDEAMAVTSP